MNAYIYGDKKWFYLTVIFSVLVSTESVFFAWVVNNFITIATQGNYSELIQTIVISVVGLIILFGLDIIYIRVKNRLVQSCNENIKIKLFKHLMSKSHGDPVKEDVSLMTNDLKQLETKGILNEISIMRNVLMFLFAIGYGILLDYVTILVFFGASLLPVLASKIFSSKIKATSQEWSKENSAYMGKTTDYISGIDTIVNYKAQNVAEKNFNQSATALEKALTKMNDMVGISTYTVNAVANLAILSLAIGFGIFRVLSGFLTVGQLIAIVQISNNLINPLLAMLGAVNERQTTAGTSQLLRSINDDNHQSEDNIEVNSLQIHKGAIALEGKTLFDNLNLTINKGEKVLIVAPSGYGKSTLLKAIAGFLDFSEGSYYINGQSSSHASLKTAASLIKQDPFIFDNTILFNITMGNEYRQSDLEAVIQAAQLEEVVASKGLDYQVGENGNNLSGGQIQRLEIARGLLANRPMILADEVTSALDVETGDKISNYLLNAKQTLIEVSHKVSDDQLKKYDQVVYLDKLG